MLVIKEVARPSTRPRRRKVARGLTIVTMPLLFVVLAAVTVNILPAFQQCESTAGDSRFYEFAPRQPPHGGPVTTSASSFTLPVDGQTLTVPAGSTVLQAIRQGGTHLPTLCYLD
jgi:2Fe-2S iron-sulfur cluster binding domain